MDTGDKDKDTINMDKDTVDKENASEIPVKYVGRSYEIPDHEYAELEPDDTPTVKFLKRLGLVLGFLLLMGVVIFAGNALMEKLYPDSLKEVRMKEASAASKEKETEKDLNIKIDDVNGANAGKSLDELVDGGSALNYGNDYYESISKASESTDVKESVSNSNNEEASAGESEGAVSLENEVSEEEINKMVESKIAKDNQPVESQGIGGLEEYYKAQIESAHNNESLQAEIDELMKKVQ